MQLDATESSALDLDFMKGHDEFDWNAVAGTDFDVDQWLQFPPEGVSNSDENIMAGVFGNGQDGMMSADQALNWAINSDGDAAMQYAAAR